MTSSAFIRTGSAASERSSGSRSLAHWDVPVVLPRPRPAVTRCRMPWVQMSPLSSRKEPSVAPVLPCCKPSRPSLALAVRACAPHTITRPCAGPPRTFCCGSSRRSSTSSCRARSRARCNCLRAGRQSWLCAILTALSDPSRLVKPSGASQTAIVLMVDVAREILEPLQQGVRTPNLRSHRSRRPPMVSRHRSAPDSVPACIDIRNAFTRVHRTHFPSQVDCCYVHNSTLFTGSRRFKDRRAPGGASALGWSSSRSPSSWPSSRLSQHAKRTDFCKTDLVVLETREGRKLQHTAR